MLTFTFSLARTSVLLMLAGVVQAASAQTLPPLADFFDNAPFHSPVLSPNGKMLAMSQGLPGKRDGLIVIDLSEKKTYATVRFADADVGRVQWVNDKRLLFDSTDRQLAQGDVKHAPGLYAVNFDGTEMRQLADHQGRPRITVDTAIRRKMLPYNTYLFPQPGPKNTDLVYVISPDTDNGRTTELLHLNTVNGRSTSVKAPPGTGQWLLDHNGEPRLALAYAEDRGTIHYRQGSEQDWKALHTFNLFKGREGNFSPLAFGPDGTLYVTATGGTDKTAIHTYDLVAGKLSEKPVITVTEYDFNGRLIFSRDKLLGARLTTDAESAVWIDPGMKALQAEIDQRLSNTTNLITVPARAETPFVLVEAYSDVQPRVFMLYNTETKALSNIGATRPRIKPADMGLQDVVRYNARDGLPIPARLTLPARYNKDSKDKPPMVVLVHGGPFVRGGSWGWKAEVQFLASRGYAVLEPEFRGSTGYGHKHFRAGWKQWGLAMQNDIADGAKWAVAQGYADPGRICIAGASYGGYAALMGLVNDPDLYKCGINWIGVTDINLLYNGHWLYADDHSPLYRKYGMPAMIGDQKLDAAQLAATSPLLQAARVTRPVLLAYGGADRRVPLYHGDKFYKEVKKTNPAVEWVEYPEEGHGWALPATRIDFWGRVEKFLEKNIGKK